MHTCAATLSRTDMSADGVKLSLENIVKNADLDRVVAIENVAPIEKIRIMNISHIACSTMNVSIFGSLVVGYISNTFGFYFYSKKD